ncbi:hypothetical protein [Streptomyces sp. NPDC101237]|uniref:hypothetical protein n=1 Tax=Streptomyces sp. NPDC101237 TaxID=3366139 RepID=UPI0038137285
MTTTDDGASTRTGRPARPRRTGPATAALARASAPLACAAAVACLSLSLVPHPAASGRQAATGAPRPGPSAADRGSLVLRADRLVLRGARFRGTATVRTATGTVRAVKLTVRSLDAVDLDLTAGRGRAALRLRARPATTATLKGQGATGEVTLYVRKLSGRVTGVGGGPLPAHRALAVTPDAVPRWLARPAGQTRTITLVSATVTQVVQRGGRLSVKGAELRAAPR